MSSFVTKGYTGKTIHCSLSHTPLEIKGNWHLRGMHSISKEDETKLIYILLKNNPNIQFIAISTKNSGKVYSNSNQGD